MIRSLALLLAIVSGVCLPHGLSRVHGQMLGKVPRATTVSTSATSSHSSPRVSFWKHSKNRNVMRLEEWPDGELRFWAHQLDPEDADTREALAKRGLEVDVTQMTSDDVLRFCGFGYDNGMKYVRVKSEPGDTAFEVIVAIGFDYFRGVEHPKYGETRWAITLRHIDHSRLHIAGRLIGWRGVVTFGQVKAQTDLVRVTNPPEACTPTPVYAVKAR